MTLESQLEDNLIAQLTQDVHQWKFRDDLRTVDQLWDNFFRILESNNKDQLNDHPLTPNEKMTVRTAIVKPTFYRATEFMVGANRQVRYHLRREDSSIPDADLLILDNTNIAGGNSVYEVVHQVQLQKKTALNQDRRFDVSLLINGLPVIHIELKAPNVPYKKAFNQIQKYIDEGQFTDIYSFVEMFVVTNGTQTRYISAGQNLNAKFLTAWVDKNNKRVDNYLSFAEEFLSIPAAHHMIANYVVLDSENAGARLCRQRSRCFLFQNSTPLSFMFPLFKKINWKRYDESTGVPSLSKNTIEKIRVSFPQNNEQVKIGDLFQKITQIITLHDQKLRLLKYTKQSLLQKMFI